MPIGADLVLHEEPDPESVRNHGPALGRVIERTARRWNTPLAIPLMDLRLEKADLLARIGVSVQDADAFHFIAPLDGATLAALCNEEAGSSCPGSTARDEALQYIASIPGLYPVGMAIGPFSLVTRLMADPIAAAAMAGSDGIGHQPRDERKGTDGHADGVKAGDRGNVLESFITRGAAGTTGTGLFVTKRRQRGTIERSDEVKRVCILHGDADACEKIGFLETQIHERNGEWSVPAAGRALDYAAQSRAMVANGFRVRLFMQNEVSADGHAKAVGGEAEKEVSIRYGVCQAACQTASAARRFLTRPTAPLAFSLKPSAPISFAYWCVTGAPPMSTLT